MGLSSGCSSLRLGKGRGEGGAARADAVGLTSVMPCELKAVAKIGDLPFSCSCLIRKEKGGGGGGGEGVRISLQVD